jgi:hypothetical protein
MHAPGLLRRELLAARFGERQSVHVGADEKSVAAFSQVRHDSGSTDAAPGGHPEPSEAFRDFPCGADLFERELGVPVEIPAHLDDRAVLVRWKAIEQLGERSGKRRHGADYRSGFEGHRECNGGAKITA